jgi:hypothetical protein
MKGVTQQTVIRITKAGDKKIKLNFKQII